MIFFTWLHLLSLGFIALLVLISIYFIIRLKSKTRLAYIIILLIISIIASFITIIAVDKVTKKAVISKITNKRILSKENIVFSGYVHNVGAYKIGFNKLEIKLLNMRKLIGNMKGGDFYKTRSFFKDLFSSTKNKLQEHPNTIIESFTIAKNLKPNERKKFKISLKYPSYFKSVDFRLKLYSDLRVEMVRIK